MKGIVKDREYRVEGLKKILGETALLLRKEFGCQMGNHPLARVWRGIWVNAGIVCLKGKKEAQLQIAVRRFVKSPHCISRDNRLLGNSIIRERHKGFGEITGLSRLKQSLAEVEARI